MPVSWAHSASAAPGSVFPAAGERRNLPFSVFSVVSVPLFNSDLTIHAFATFIVNVYSSARRPKWKTKVQKILLSRSESHFSSGERFPFVVEEVSEVPRAGLGRDRCR